MASATLKDRGVDKNTNSTFIYYQCLPTQHCDLPHRAWQSSKRGQHLTSDRDIIVCGSDRSVFQSFIVSVQLHLGGKRALLQHLFSIVEPDNIRVRNRTDTFEPYVRSLGDIGIERSVSPPRTTCMCWMACMVCSVSPCIAFSVMILSCSIPMYCVHGCTEVGIFIIPCMGNQPLEL